MNMSRVECTLRRDPEFFGEQELELIHIAKKLSEALELEALLTESGIDYAVEADKYAGGVIFRAERIGAFFYVLPEMIESTREVLRRGGFRARLPDDRG
jgi:hypothetical protein